MARRYNLEELLLLRDSPLICKPDSLPPTEEWMGGQESNQRKPLPLRGHADDQNFTSGKRPGITNFHHISRRSSTAPEDIVLGPPKTAFSSSNSRNAAKLATSEASDETSKDRSNLHEKQYKDKQNGDGDVGKEGRQNGLNTRRIGRDDREEWHSGRSRRSHDQEDGDGRPRRMGDRDRTRWDTKDLKESLDTEEGRPFGRRDGQGRGKFEQSWFRGEKTQEGDPKSGRNEWRRDRRGDDWDRGRSEKAEQDPEWMDPTETEEPKQARTHEDFQRWKERMKAGGTPTEEKLSSAQEEKEKSAPSKAEAPKLDATPNLIMNTPEISAAMDSFFASFNAPHPESKPAEVKTAKKGRFATLFSQPIEESVKEAPATAKTTENPEHKSNAMSEADHFHRILQMLGQRGANDAPQNRDPAKARPSSATGQPQSAISEQPQSPVAESFRRQSGPPPGDSPLHNTSSMGLETLLSTRSPTQEQGPRRQTPVNKDVDLLLRLMQQTPQSQNAVPPPQQCNAPPTVMRHPPGILQLPDQRNQIPKPQKDKLAQSQLPEQHMITDPVRAEQQPPFPREVLQRRPTNGTTQQPPLFFDEPFFNELRQANQQPPPNIQMNQNRPPGFPPAMQRPPGFEQVPQGWPPQHPSAPPGIPNPPHRGMVMGPQFPPLSQQMPRQSQMGMPPPAAPPPNPQRQRKYTGGDHFPPSMGPPPGFMANGPPPSFGALPHGMGAGFDAMVRERALMEMYTANGQGMRGNGRGVGGGGAGAGGGLMGGYQ